MAGTGEIPRLSGTSLAGADTKMEMAESTWPEVNQCSRGFVI